MSRRVFFDGDVVIHSRRVVLNRESAAGKLLFYSDVVMFEDQSGVRRRLRPGVETDTAKIAESSDQRTVESVIGAVAALLKARRSR